MPTATESVVNLVSGVSADVFGVVGFIILLTALGLSKGKDNLIVMMLSIYPAALITEHFPYYDSMSLGSGTLANVLGPLLIFIIVTVTSFFIFKNYIDTNYQHHSFWRFVEVIILAIANIGLFITVLYHIVGIESFYNFSFVFDSLFTSNLAMLFWLVLPIISIPLFIRA